MPEIRVDIGADLEANITKAENKIKAFRAFCEDESGKIRQAFINGWEGLSDVDQKLNNLKSTINGFKIDSSLAKALQGIGQVVNGKQIENLDKLAETFQKLQAATGQGVNTTMQQASTQLNNVAQAADQTAQSVSRLAQAQAQTTPQMSRFMSAFYKFGTWFFGDANLRSQNFETATNGNTTTSIEAQSNAINQLTQSISRLVEQLSQQQAVSKQTASGNEQVSATSKKAALDVSELADRLQNLVKSGTSGASITELVKNVNDINIALGKVGTSDRNMEMYFINMKKYLTDIINLRQQGGNDYGVVHNEQELNKLYQERLSLYKQLLSAQNQNEVTGNRYGYTVMATNEYIQKLQEQITTVDQKIQDAQSRMLSFDSSKVEIFDEKKALAEAAAASKLYEALNKLNVAREKLNQTQESKAQAEYAKLTNQLNAAERSLNKFNATMADPAKAAVFESAEKGAKAAQAEIDRINARLAELRSQYGAGLFSSTDNRAAMKQYDQEIKDFQAAEKEKTNIARQEAAERRAAEMHEAKMATEQAKQLKLQAQAELTQASAQLNTAKSSATTSKEQREIELQQRRAEAIQRVVEQIDALDKTDKNYAQDLNRLNAILTNLINKKAATATTTSKVTAEEALQAAAAARSSGSLKELADAYKKLKTARDSVEQGTAQWNKLNNAMTIVGGNIETLKKKSGELKQEHSGLLNIAGQLQQRLIMAFSVSSISGFIQKMVEVRAQFELQRIALGAILQDIDKANEVFKQVQNMALESPFSIMQLERATKQIAAFGVEADKLKPSIKMLADISAGLGVDIDRLILVYGHIKANNALQQLHVRQFTNAGFNIAQNLADYYTELEGKLVSVADVTARIHKKMVSFADVEEVLKRVTSAGGMFYDMQKKQSDSLWGQMQRIKDQYDLMLNEIGQSNQGMISAALTTIRSLIKSWREFSQLIKAIAYSFVGWAAYKYILVGLTTWGKKIITVFQNWRVQAALLKAELNSGAKAANLFSLSLKGVGTAIGSFVTGALVSAAIFGLVTLIAKIFEVDGAAQQLNEELGRIGDSQSKELGESIAQYKSLAETVRDTSTAYSERQEALTELHRVYGKILPQYMLEEEYIRNNADGYDAATDAIQRYYAAQEYSQKMTAIESSQFYTDALSEMKALGKKMLENGVFDEYITKDAVNKWMEVITKEMASGKIPATADQLRARMVEIFGAHMNTADAWEYMSTGFENISKNINKLIDVEGNLQLATLGGKNAMDDFSQSLKNAPIEQVTAKYGEASKKIALYQKQIAQTEANMQSETTDTALASSSKKIRDLQARIEQIRDIQDKAIAALEERGAERIKESFDTEFTAIENTMNAYGKYATERREISQQPIKTDEDNERLKELEKNMDSARESLVRLIAQMSPTYADSRVDADGKESASVKSLYEAYDALVRKKTELQRTYTGSEEEKKQLEELEKSILKAKDAANEAANSLSAKLDPALLKDADNAFKLEEAIQAIKVDSFENFARQATTHLSDFNLGLLNTIGNLDTLYFKLNSYGLGTPFDNVPEEPRYLLPSEAAAQLKAQEAAEKALKREEEVYEDAAKKVGISVAKLSKYKRDKNEADVTYAQRLNEQAKQFENVQKHYNTLDAEQKKAYLEEHDITEARINDEAKQAEALKKIAAVYDETGTQDPKSKKSGKDEFLEMLKKRRETLQSFYKEYETAQKSFSNEESLAKIKKNYTDVFNTLGMDMTEVIGNGMDKQGLAKNLDDLIAIVAEKRPKALAEFQKYAAQVSMEVDVDVQTQKLEDFKQDMQNIFDDYELSKTFKDLGLNIDLTYMVGGSPTTLDDVKNKLEELRSEILSDNLTFDRKNELQKQYEEFLKKIREIENKELQERIKEYAKYITSAYGEAATEQIKTYKEIANVQSDFAKAQKEVKDQMLDVDKTSDKYRELQRQYELYGQQMVRITANMVDEMNKKINNTAWNKFKTSEIFNQMYQDVSNLSKGSLDKLIGDLTELRAKMQNASNVDYKGLREVSTYIEKLKEARNAISPLSQLGKAMKEVNALRKQGITFDKAQQNLLAANDAINSYQAQIDDLETVIGLKEQQKDTEIDTSKLTENQRTLYKGSAVMLNGMLALARAQLNTETEKASTASSQLDTFNRTVALQEKSLAELQQIQQYSDSIFDSVYEVVELYGDVDEGAKAVAKAMIDGAFNAAQMVIQMQEYTVACKAAGVATNAMLGVLGWIALAIQTIASVWSSLAKAHDNDLSEQIKRLKNNVDDLSRAYEKLQTAMSKALSYAKYQQDYASAEANLNQQIQYYQQMIALEEQKKNADSDAIREYRQAIEDLRDDLEELKETKITDLGGFGESNYRDIAEEFISTWVDAFKETGDGLDALNDKWDEYVQNLFIKQAVAKKAAATYQKALSLIDNAIEKGLSGEELAATVKAAQTIISDNNEDMNNYLKMLAEVFGITADGTSELSDLQQGIQNITEEQAAAIEAYMNSIRFYVAMQYDVLCEIQQTLNSIREQYSSLQSPILDVLKEIRNSINSYASKFAAAFKSTASGYKLQVC